MYVGVIMRSELVTVPRTTSLKDAVNITKDKGIDHLLVVDTAGKLIGIVSDRDLKKSSASPATSLSTHEINYLLDKLTVDTIMTQKIFAVSPGTTIERAAQVMQENRIRCLPVMKDDKLEGIITTTDVLGVLLKAIGIDTDSARFTVLVKDRVGVIAEISQLLQEQQINIRSLITLPLEDHKGVYHLVLRVSAKDGEKAISAIRDKGFKVFTGYVEDIEGYLP